MPGGVELGEHLVGRHAVELDLEGRRRVVALSRFGVPRIPDKDLTVQDGDILYIAAVRNDAVDLAEHLKKVGAPE